MVGLTRSSTVLLTAIGVGTFFSAALPVLAPSLIQLVTPGRIRARATALYLTAVGLVGLGLGPPLAALLGEQLFKGTFAIGSGMEALLLVPGPIESLAIRSFRKPYRHAPHQAEAGTSAEHSVRKDCGSSRIIRELH